MKNITITNRATYWPDWFVRPVVEWIAQRAGIDWPYTMLIKGARRTWGWAGRGGKYHGWVSMHRRSTVKFTKDRRFKWGPTYDVRPGIETFVWLLAHEMHHATPENRAAFKRGATPSRENRDAGEFITNEWAMAALVAWRAEWPEMRRRIMAGLRRQRERERSSALRLTERRAVATSTEAKLAAAQAGLAKWEAKARKCETFIRKYRRRIRALHAAQSRKAAAAPKA